METISGVFKSREAAEHTVKTVQAAGISTDKITLLTPGTAVPTSVVGGNDKAVNDVSDKASSIPADATEQPGMGKAMGALAGGAVGITGGALLVALIPGVGPITAIGLLGAAIAGAAGAAVGGAVGDKAEKATVEGVPEDEIFVYEDALRQGRSVVIVLAENKDAASLLRELMKIEGAESVDAAREQWWVGLRSAEEGHYEKSGKKFEDDEKYYRQGFEAALHARTRCMEFDQVSGEMNAALEDLQQQHPGEQVEEPFILGYQRGREYYQRLCEEKRAA
jgi:uncharacterized membrane protein